MEITEVQLESPVVLQPNLSPDSGRWAQLLEDVLNTEKVLQRILRPLPFRLILECCLVNKLWLRNIRKYLRMFTPSSITVTLSRETYNGHLTGFATAMKNCGLYPVSTLRICIPSEPGARWHGCVESNTSAVIKELQEVRKLEVLRLSVKALLEHNHLCDLFDLLQKLLDQVSEEHVKYLETDVPDLSTIFRKSISDDRFEYQNFRTEYMYRNVGFRYRNLEVFQPIPNPHYQRLDKHWGWEALKATNLKAFYLIVYASQLQHRQPPSHQALKYCNLYGYIGLCEFNRLAGGKPELVSLVLYGVGSSKHPEEFFSRNTLELIRALNKLLQSSSQTLVELRTNLPILNAISQSCNSILTSLKILDLHYESDVLVPLLGCIDFERNFPNLLTVFIRAHYDHDTSDIVPDIFYECEYLDLVPSVTVRNLIVQLNMVGNAEVTHFEPFHLESLVKAFPLVENLCLQNDMGEYMSNKFKYPLTLKALMGITWPELKRLEIVTGLTYKKLEHIFIGVTKEELQLWRRLGMNSKFGDIQIATVAPSLLNFAKLKFFKFSIPSSEDMKGRVPTTVDSKEEGLSSFLYNLEYESKELTSYKEKPNIRFWRAFSERGGLVPSYDYRQFTVNLNTDSGIAEWSLRM